MQNSDISEVNQKYFGYRATVFSFSESLQSNTTLIQVTLEESEDYNPSDTIYLCNSVSVSDLNGKYGSFLSVLQGSDSDISLDLVI
jgi:hypothetical protein